jgi:glycerophosphoryl diester phosphodiesterase
MPIPRSPIFDLQGHRGARGLRPENTLPGFEVAFDLGVTSTETDIHLTADGVPVLIHDPSLPDGRQVRSLTLTQMRSYRADVNLDPKRFPQQDKSVTPLARIFAEHHEIDPYTPPTLTDLFAFAVAYAGDLGRQAGKTTAQRERAASVVLDLELKRVPFCSENVGPAFEALSAGLLERQVVDVIRAARMLGRVRVRSFDHRTLIAIRQLEPDLPMVGLIDRTIPANPVDLVRQAHAQFYAPNYEFLDEFQVCQCDVGGILVLPWTVNEVTDMERLLDWGVDGITTDYPDRLVEVLRKRGMVF